MSHPAVKIVATWLADVTSGLDACAAAVPRLSGHEAPPSLGIYNEIDHAWVARGLLPDTADATASITYPLAMVRFNGGTWEGGMGTPYDGGRMQEGQIQIVVEIYQQNTDTADGVQDGMYLMRGLRASLGLLDNAPQTSRDEANTTVVIHPSVGMQQVKMKPERGDKVIADALVITYPVFESTPATA